MSSFILKIIAMISMLLDHIGFVFYNHSFLRIIGRLAFPIFAFQSVVGYEQKHTPHPRLRRARKLASAHSSRSAPDRHKRYHAEHYQASYPP